MALQSPTQQHDVLLQEYNHRLFNTISVIAIEVAGCARTREDEDLRPRLRRLGERFQALASLHRLLAFANCDAPLEDYLHSVCDTILRVFGRADIKVQFRVDDVSLAQRRYMTVALIVVELVINSLKHSLVSGLPGVIWMELNANRANIELSLGDSLQAPVTSFTIPRILKSLADSINADVCVIDRGGYTTVVHVPCEAAEDVARPLVALDPRWSVGDATAPWRAEPGLEMPASF